jgi:phage gpG-like protein
VARGFSTRIEVDGLEKPLAALRRVRELGGDTTPFMEDARGILVASTLRRFETGKGPGGIPWAPTKRQVRQAVGSRGPNKARILVDTGDLQDSIRGEAGPDYVEVGSDGLKNPVKALANQFGSSRQTVVVRHQRRMTMAFGAPLAEPVEVTVRGHGRVTNLPARPFVGVDDEDKVDVEDAWRDRLIRTFTQGASNGRS